ncbi:MAG: hypothetical protein HEP71_06315 [Roseivirga sp.]|nr:hypothetical protein [Roseivirga sp.]
MKNTQKDIKLSHVNIFSGLLILLTTFIFSCEPKEDIIIEEEGDLPALAVLFEADYINHAWGYQHNGWFLDNHGRVRKYEMPDREEWNTPDNDGYISKESLEANYDLANTLAGEVSRGIVRQQEDLIAGAIDGEMSDPVNRAADMGGFGWYCYSWDADKEMYKRQTLGVTGDWEQFNLAPDAQALLKWLQTIQVD